jgi:hypothetical protein
MHDQPADLLDRAADALFISGRCTGAGIDAEGRMCVRGAIAHARGDNPANATNIMGQGNAHGVAEIEAYLYEHPDLIRSDVYAAYADDYIPHRFPSWIWNDTTHGLEGDALVIDTLRQCAKDLRNSQGHCPSDPQATDGSVAA